MPKNAILDSEDVYKKFTSGEVTLDTKTGRLHKASVKELQAFQEGYGADIKADGIKKKKTFAITERTN